MHAALHTAHGFGHLLLLFRGQPAHGVAHHVHELPHLIHQARHLLHHLLPALGVHLGQLLLKSQHVRRHLSELLAEDLCIARSSSAEAGRRRRGGQWSYQPRPVLECWSW